MPLWQHADVTVGCLDAGKHVLCEKMMAWDVDGCERMTQAAARNRKRARDRIPAPLQRRLPVGIRRDRPARVCSATSITCGWCGTATATGGAQGSRRSPDYDASKWGYPTFEHLWNWRLYWKYSQGLIAELASHQLNAANWFLGSAPTAVTASGGIHRFNDGREVPDHIYSMWEYPGGRTATYSSVESNAFENRYEVFFGTKATLLVRNENEALMFEEGSTANRQTAVQVSPREGAGGRHVRDTAGQYVQRPRRRSGLPGGPGERAKSAVRDTPADLAILLGGARRHTDRMRSRASDALRARVHPRQRGDQAAGAAGRVSRHRPS